MNHFENCAIIVIMTQRIEPTISPSIPATGASSIPIAKIHLSLGEKVAAFFWSFIPFYQGWKLQKALQCGRLDKAVEHIRKGGWWWYRHTIQSEDFRSLTLTREINSIRLILAQFDFDSGSPTGGSRAAKAFIEARDGPDFEKQEILSLLTGFKKTKLDDDAAVYGASKRIFVSEPKKNRDYRDAEDFYLELIYTETKNAKEFIKRICKVFTPPQNKQALREFVKYYLGLFNQIEQRLSIGTVKK